MLKQVESLLASPEQLLESLDAQIALHRSRRATTGRQRGVVVAVGLVLLVGGATVALCALFSTVQGLPHREAGEPSHLVLSQR